MDGMVRVGAGGRVWIGVAGLDGLDWAGGGADRVVDLDGRDFVAKDPSSKSSSRGAAGAGVAGLRRLAEDT